MDLPCSDDVTVECDAGDFEEIAVPAQGPPGPVPWAPAAPWAAGSAYTARAPASLVTQEGGTYLCVADHVADGWAADFAAGKWVLVAARGNVGPQGLRGEPGLQGPQGIQGPQGNTGATGPAAWSSVSAWTTGTSYVVGPPASVVTEGGSTYVCRVGHTSGTFATDLAAGRWALIAMKGDTGPQGIQGIQGPPGSSWAPSGANKFQFSTGAGAVAEADITVAGRALLDDIDAAAQRTTLGLGQFLSFGANVTDWNSAVAAGWYMSGQAANAPAAGWFIGEVIAPNGIWSIQRLYGFTDPAAPSWQRLQIAGVWSPWRHLPTVETDGSITIGARSQTLVDAAGNIPAARLGAAPGGWVGAAAGQIAFPAAQAASSNANTLDDYEEGTWTPTLTFETPGNLSVSYATRVGLYTKIGNVVTLQVDITTSAFTHSTAAGALLITGLPFAAKSAGQVHRVAGGFQGITKAGYTQFVMVIQGGQSQITISACGSGQAISGTLVADVPSSGAVRISGPIQYMSD